MIRRLDELHLWARESLPLQRLAVISRILLALAFIPTGMVKLLGERFTTMPVDTPVGYFFEAMYQSGFYWNFLGLGQVMAGVLLLIPVTSTLGAVMFFPIVLNITVVTWSVGFKGTVYVTSLMLLASLFLLCWDWDRLRGIMIAPLDRPVAPTLPMSALERTGYQIGTLAGLALLLVTRGLAPVAALGTFLVLGVVAMTMVLAAWVKMARQVRSRVRSAAS